MNQLSKKRLKFIVGGENPSSVKCKTVWGNQTTYCKATFPSGKTCHATYDWDGYVIAGSCSDGYYFK